MSLAAWRSSSKRLLSVSNLSTSPRVHFLGLINRISFKSSSFSLINIRRSRSESSTPGQASLSSLASCIFRFAILQQEGKKGKQLFHEECPSYYSTHTWRCTMTNHTFHSPEEESSAQGQLISPFMSSLWGHSQAWHCQEADMKKWDFNSGLLPMESQVPS